MLGLVEINATFIFQIINTLIIYFALRHFLFKPVTEFMENRRRNIEVSIQEAEIKNKESDELKSQYEEKLKEIKKERNTIIEEANRRAEDRGNEIILSAEEEARKILEKARLEVEREKKKMMNELKGEISQLAIAAAEKVIEKDLDQGAHQQMIQQFIDKAGETQWQN
ncbi:F0F1 ATP synthase subunit B [Alkaliphilus sp. MSJ-5]|uniref:ATP synthase subunit b n=1 Tax=Alkaliphilus flagellatus TaxID=2841507 RepID=A0ABS6G289_9FIRM|nr:F0F1 ATP synthase subunit B [Alkaliphilus flagellatus]MBU5676595.1 F0F1 ATP synthase subunit B [Alkaliphilus flagellatus]